MIAGAGGSLLTFLFQKYGISAVVASCVVGLIGALVGQVIRMPHVSLVVFTGSFVGMTSLSIGSISIVICGGALSGLVYSLTLHLFVGYGGRLGIIAFLSTLAIFGLVWLMKQLTFVKTIFLRK